MILAVDVAYSGTTARVAGVLFAAWDSNTIARELVLDVADVAEYVPGQFYLRELPCILKLLEQVDAPLDCIVIDGYVTLGTDAAPGLGMHLWEAVGRATPVIGVAKSKFIGTPEHAALYRGGSSRALYVSAAGMPLEEAKVHIAGMKGEHRLPEFLKAVDRLCRD